VHSTRELFSFPLNNPGVICKPVLDVTCDEAKTGMNRPQHMAQARCAYCVENNEFRLMIDLTGGAGGTFYCTKCHHLTRSGEPALPCLCANCRKLNRPSTPG